MELWCVESLGMQASKTGLVGVRITRCRAKLMWECALSWFAKVHVVRDYMYSICLSTATCTCTRVVRVLYPRQRDNRCHDLLEFNLEMGLYLLSASSGRFREKSYWDGAWVVIYTYVKQP